MPIKALEQRKLKLPVVGKIKKGDKKPSNAPGKDLNQYFRFSSTSKECETAFNKIYGSRPSVIPFYFPYDDFDDNFDANNELYVKGKLEHRCDGEYVLMHKSNGRYNRPPYGEVPCPGKCKSTAVVSMIIPDKSFLDSFGGIVTIKLNSQTEVPRLYSELKMIHDKFGSLRGIKFQLYRYETKIRKPDGVRVTKWLVGVRPDEVVFSSLMDVTPSALGEYDYVVDDDGVVIDEPEIAESETIQEKSPEPVDNWAQWFNGLSTHERAAALGKWADAVDGITRYDSIHALKAASKKLADSGTENFLLMIHSSTSKEEKRVVFECRHGLYMAIKMYAECRQKGLDEFSALKAVHAQADSFGAFSELLKPIATDDFDGITSASNATQTSLIPSDDKPVSSKTKTNAAMM